jgi:hypothetical protein
MANTIGFGQAAVNNTIGFGQGAVVGVTPFSNTKSIELNGIDDYVDCGTDASLNITNISISAWIKTSGGSGFDAILTADSPNGSYRRYQLGLNHTTGFLSFYFWNPSNVLKSITGTTVVNDANWHQVMVVNDGTNLKLYVDGVLDNSNTNGDTIRTAGTTTTAIGSIYGSNFFFLGNIDEVAVWNSDQSANVSTIYNGGVPNDLTSLSPLSWWRCGDGDTSPTLTDNGSGGNNGTMTNFTTFSTDVPT